MRKALNSCVEAVAVTAVVSDEVMDKLEHQAKVWGGVCGVDGASGNK